MAALLLHRDPTAQATALPILPCVSPVHFSQGMVTITREGKIVNSPLPLLYLSVVAAAVDTFASEHWMYWQACNARSLLGTSKLMYRGPCIVLRWKYFSVTTN